MRVNIIEALGTALILAACFDVEKVDVTRPSHSRLLIDDFEDGDQQPSSSLFGPWYCYAYSSVAPQPTCGVAPGFDSVHAYSLKFDLEIPSIVTVDGIGVGLEISPSVGTVDIGSYQTLHFSAKLETSSSTLPPGISFNVHIACSLVDHPPGSVNGGFCVERKFEPTGDWQSYTIAMTEFEQPPWQGIRMFDQNECLKLADSLAFHVESPQLADGQSAAGVLMIDDVWLD